MNKGLPSFTITGMALSSIQEARHRSQSALSAMGFTFPPLKIVINLSPSDLPKQGSHFDLPIALLIALHNRELPESTTDEWFAMGELGLEGKLKENQNIYPILLSLVAQGYKGKILLPKENEALYRQIPHLRLAFVDSLQEAVDLLLTPKESEEESPTPLNFPALTIKDEPFYYHGGFPLDFSEVKGQEVAKRAALIAAAGFHNLLLEGSPGSGKSMIAKRLRYILPPMSKEEILTSAKISLYTQNELRYEALRNFRSPHASSSKAAMLGSATSGEPKPGEIALAHLGILFLDELPHFPKMILESLREPLENQRFSISRVQAKIDFETSFLLVAAQNPCPCGNLLSSSKECRCNEAEIIRYKNRLSEPFLDRIDLFVAMQEGQERESRSSVSSQELFDKVLGAFRMQKERGQSALNGKLDDREAERFCALPEALDGILGQAIRRFSLSQRGITKLKKVARTIADLDSSCEITKEHLLEALSYRKR